MSTGVENGDSMSHYLYEGVPFSSRYEEGFTYRWEYHSVFPAHLLNPRQNIIAAVLVDNGGDTGFELMLTGTGLMLNDR